LDDFDSYDRERERQRERYPKCCHCGERIQDDRLFVIFDNYYHVECAEDEFMKWTEDFTEDY
jgi:RNA polymerase-binding transcription factor DksA